MPDQNTIMHGGAIAAASLKYGGVKEDWLDLSTGINPVPASMPKLSRHIWQALPDADLLATCLVAAHGFYGFDSSAKLVAAPGVQALIQLLPALKPNAKVAILGPTYGEYANVFQQFGHQTRIITSLDDLDNEPILIIVNPNNPDGRVTSPNAILALAKSRAKLGGLVIIDEAFCDLTPEISVARYAGMKGILVLKSFGKFFGLAGIRLGFAAGHSDDIAKLEQMLGPWAVSGPALAIGASCFANKDLADKLAKSIFKNANAQRELLIEARLNIIVDTGLFHLVETPKATELFEVLAKQQILSRRFSDNPTWLRFGLCANGAQRLRLKQALQNSSGIT